MLVSEHVPHDLEFTDSIQSGKGREEQDSHQNSELILESPGGLQWRNTAFSSRPYIRKERTKSMSNFDEAKNSL
jgi:hypothetical protein